MQKSNEKEKPVTDAYYIRPGKASARMKSAQNARQTVFLYGSVGYGKTSFAADYLSHRRYEYYSASDLETM